MSMRTILIGVLALTFGGSAAVGVNLLYNQQSAAPPVDTVTVVVAKSDVPRGVLLSLERLDTREFPKDLVPPGASTQMEEVVGRVTAQSLLKDEPVQERKLSPKNSKGGLAALIPKGMRAFTIQTNNVAGQVAGFVLPGNNVDVLLTMNGVGPQDSTGGGVTTTLLQNVEILAVDQRLEAPTENKVDTKNLQSVTLLVTPDQAARLDLGQNRGTLHLSLRNPEDGTPGHARAATLSNLLFYQEKPFAEQAKSFVDSLAKLTEKVFASAQQPTSKKPDSAAPPALLEIRTLRGTQPGLVLVEPAGAVAKSR